MTSSIVSKNWWKSHGKTNKKPPTIWISKLKALLVTRIKALLFLWDVAKPWQIYWCLANWQKKTIRDNPKFQARTSASHQTFSQSAHAFCTLRLCSRMLGCGWITHLGEAGQKFESKLPLPSQRVAEVEVSFYWAEFFQHFSRGTVDGRNPAPVDR